MKYICENKRFKTDITKGFEHRPGIGHLGSVTDKPLYEDDHSLFLEHVVDKINGNHCYWFMWYDQHGKSLLPASAVMDEQDILAVIKNLSSIKF